jgi:hypothetical protein
MRDRSITPADLKNFESGSNQIQRVPDDEWYKDFWIIQTMRRRAISENFPAARSAGSRNKAIAGAEKIVLFVF